MGAYLGVNGKPYSTGPSGTSGNVGQAGISALPPEVRDLLLGYLTPAAAHPLACASRLWREHVVHCGAVWRGQLEARFPLTAARLQRAEARLREAQGGYLAYYEGTNYAEAMKALRDLKWGRVLSHPAGRESTASASQPKRGEYEKGIFARLVASLTSRSMPRWLRSGQKTRFLLLGLDAAGKTSIVYHLKLGEVRTVIPTIGFSMETVEVNGCRLDCWDVGGSDRINPLLRRFLQGTDGVIFVVDANDRSRFDTAEKELDRLLSDPQLQHRPLLILANKQDLPGAATAEEIAMHLRASLRLVEATGEAEPLSRPWCVQGCSAFQGPGVALGLEWLTDASRTMGPPPQ